MFGKSRIPDFIDGKRIIEVKNTKSISYTKQLRDYHNYAGPGNMDLYVRPGSKISNPLRNSGVSIYEIPFR
jgi:hypothetical protein